MGMIKGKVLEENKMQKIDQVLQSARLCQNEDELFSLIRENMPGVALEVAKSIYATPRVLEGLTRHHSITVRHEVAKNKNTSVETLKRLCDDKDMLVRDYARRTLGHKLLDQKIVP